MVGLEQFGDPGLVLVLLAHRNQVDVGTLGVFLRDGVTAWLQAGRQGVVGVDGGSVEIVQRARQLRQLQQQ